MPNLRDSLLPVIDQLRGMPPTFGLRRFSVTIRRRVWTGGYPGDPNTSAVDNDIVLAPVPRVRQVFSSSQLSQSQLQYILANGGVIDDRLFTIDRITPAYVNNGTPGGYSAQQLRLVANPDATNIEYLVILVGDDGFKRECTQKTFTEDRAFGYSMLVQETDRPRVAIGSIAVTPSPATVVHGITLQMAATATFADGSTSDLTPLVAWTSLDSSVATVDLLGVVTGVAAGTATIQATVSGVTGSVSLTVT